MAVLVLSYSHRKKKGELKHEKLEKIGLKKETPRSGNFQKGAVQKFHALCASLMTQIANSVTRAERFCGRIPRDLRRQAYRQYPRTNHFPIGSRLIVQGRIASNSYEKDGETIYTTDQTVSEFELLAFPKKDDGEGEVME